MEERKKLKRTMRGDLISSSSQLKEFAEWRKKGKAS